MILTREAAKARIVVIGPTEHPVPSEICIALASGMNNSLLESPSPTTTTTTATRKRTMKVDRLLGHMAYTQSLLGIGGKMKPLRNFLDFRTGRRGGESGTCVWEGRGEHSLIDTPAGSDVIVVNEWSGCGSDVPTTSPAVGPAQTHSSRKMLGCGQVSGSSVQEWPCGNGSAQQHSE